MRRGCLAPFARGALVYYSSAVPQTHDRTVDAVAHAVATPGGSPARLALRAPQTAQELESLLRRRLVVLGLLAAGASLFFSLFRYSTPEQWQYFRSTRVGNGFLLFEGLICVAGVVSATVTWRRRQWSMRALRAIEYLNVGLFAIYIGWAQLVAWNGTRIVPGPTGEYDPFVMRQFVDSMALRWFALIVGIATLVPETWRRSAVLVGSLALTALGLTAWMAFTDPVYSLQPGKTLFLMGFWLVIATTIAVFGSYKLSELREQVREALKFGQYRLKRKLGAGGMGDVYLAEHLMLKQECAIKLIRPERAGDPKALRRFEREVKATSLLKHWNTVQIFDYGHTDDGTFYYVMEYLPGMTLEEIVQRDGPVPAARAIHFLRQMCAALHEAHGMGLIHRDIKPANIIAGARGGVHDVAKLLDFGLVRHTNEGEGVEALTMDGALVGTPAYMSPEQVDGRTTLDGRTDIYSLGAVGYFLLTGQPPFVRAKAMEVLIAHARDAVVRPGELRADIPPDLESVVQRCLAKDPAGRYAAASELDAALAACAAAGDWTQADAQAWWSRVNA
jgi:tRNA A-37 threonylcarbamoyl transferase component Bud32